MGGSTAKKIANVAAWPIMAPLHGLNYAIDRESAKEGVKKHGMWFGPVSTMAGHVTSPLAGPPAPPQEASASRPPSRSAEQRALEIASAERIRRKSAGGLF